ncbi:ABC transporter [Coniella lustricola]|uniref:ABC transporter n=1 Tax=Coniella lustricola TaxID=2025994 RepID=A0A2T3AKH0_9PEZI|nr:ABC transporter [Coniella lustricola]
MTSMTAESVATILVSCKQTRFHIESPNYKELDIEGLNITVTSSQTEAKARVRAKAASKYPEGTEILSNAKLRLKAGQRYALIGRNGSGKSSLLKAIAERLIPGIPEQTRIAILQQTDADDIGEGATTTSSVLEYVVGRATSKDVLEREISLLSDGLSTGDEVKAIRALRQVHHERMQKHLFVLDKMARLRSGARGMAARKELIAFEKEVTEFSVLQQQKDEEIRSSQAGAEGLQEAMDMLSDLQLQLEPAKMSGVESRARQLLTGLGFSESQTAKSIFELSGGWKMRAALAAVLLQETDILILDEPTNFLDLFGIIWLQKYLRSFEDDPEAPTLILVSHDRDFISLCTDLLILKDKDLTYFHGDLSMYEASKSERRQYLSKMKDAKDKQKAHIQSTIAGNIKEGKKKGDDNRLRQAKSRQKKLDDRWGLEVGAKGGRFKLNRDFGQYAFKMRADIEVPLDDRPLHIVLPQPPDLRFPGPLISLEDVSFTYPIQKRGSPQAGRASTESATLKNMTLSIGSGDRIGVLGLNGSGKSTLIKLLVNEEKPSQGNLTTHPRLKLGYYSQAAVEHLQRLGVAEPELTALSLLTREVEGQLDEGDLRGILGELGLPGRLASDVAIRKLSGGQLVRCELARLLWRCPHILVLDEVTTHLDYETTTALREALREWKGAVVLVSHDRWFMRGVVEGAVDDGEDDVGDDSDDDAGESGMRRRDVYRIKDGKLIKLDGGVQQFENIVEKKAGRLLPG